MSLEQIAWSAEERLQAELEDTIEAERNRRGPVPKYSFQLEGLVLSLRADRSRFSERIATMADIDPDGDPASVLDSYKAFIKNEIRYADRRKWLLVEGRLDLDTARELVSWIIEPFAHPISAERAADIGRKALDESVWST